MYLTTVNDEATMAVKTENWKVREVVNIGEYTCMLTVAYKYDKRINRIVPKELNSIYTSWTVKRKSKRIPITVRKVMLNELKYSTDVISLKEQILSKEWSSLDRLFLETLVVILSDKRAKVNVSEITELLRKVSGGIEFKSLVNLENPIEKN